MARSKKPETLQCNSRIITLLAWQVSLCEQTFPLLLYNILVADREDYRSILSRQVQAFFSSVGPTHGSTHRLGGVHPDSVRTMLDMVMYLRTVNRAKKRYIT